MDKKLPNKPGVYFFKDAQNTIIYVGKATCLQSRVQSYFQKQGKDWKIDSLIAEHQTIDHIVTGTETEAALNRRCTVNDLDLTSPACPPRCGCPTTTLKPSQSASSRASAAKASSQAIMKAGRNSKSSGG